MDKASTGDVSVARLHRRGAGWPDACWVHGFDHGFEQITCAHMFGATLWAMEAQGLGRTAWICIT